MRLSLTSRRPASFRRSSHIIFLFVGLKKIENFNYKGWGGLGREILNFQTLRIQSYHYTTGTTVVVTASGAFAGFTFYLAGEFIFDAKIFLKMIFSIKGAVQYGLREVPGGEEFCVVQIGEGVRGF
jgi:hypothetical protein